MQQGPPPPNNNNNSLCSTQRRRLLPRYDEAEGRFINDQCGQDDEGTRNAVRIHIPSSPGGSNPFNHDGTSESTEPRRLLLFTSRKLEKEAAAMNQFARA